MSAVEGSKITLEITESAEINDFEHIGRVMSTLNKEGIKFALDDFGSGYSSFNYITRLRFDYIKIDKSIIHNLLSTDHEVAETSHHIIHAITQIAKTTHIKTIAEGIESVELLNKIDTFDIDLLQGYLFSKPQPDIDLHKITYPI